MSRTALIGTLLMAAAIESQYYGKPRRIISQPGDKGKQPVRAVDSRQLREFSIKGHKVMAYSRKDAITRLKHMKKI